MRDCWRPPILNSQSANLAFSWEKEEMSYIKVFGINLQDINIYKLQEQNLHKYTLYWKKITIINSKYKTYHFKKKNFLARNCIKREVKPGQYVLVKQSRRYSPSICHIAYE